MYFAKYLMSSSTLLCHLKFGLYNSNLVFQQAHYHDGSETTRLLLTSVCPSLADMDPSVMEHLLDVWGAVCRRIFSHYRLSVWSYFTFLKLNGGVRSWFSLMWMGYTFENDDLGMLQLGSYKHLQNMSCLLSGIEHESLPVQEVTVCYCVIFTHRAQYPY